MQGIKKNPERGDGNFRVENVYFIKNQLQNKKEPRKRGRKHFIYKRFDILCFI